ncbi:MAG TPA: hypothetical protein VFS75_00365 [Candidatus Paceibacterota bacterium]|nr:hypothetical protein [Candidatus Paceibacterota bacterium]
MNREHRQPHKIPLDHRLFLILAFLVLFSPLRAAADTVTYTVSDASFSSSVSGACDTSITNATTTDGAQGTVLTSTCVGKSDTPVVSWTKSLTWEDMGVPVGATVSSVDGSFKYRVAQESVSATQAAALALNDSGDVSACTTSSLEVSFDPGAVSGTYSTRNATGTVPVKGICAFSYNQVTLHLSLTPATGNNNSATSELRADDVQLVITYMPSLAPTLSGTLYTDEGRSVASAGKTVSVRALNGLDTTLSTTTAADGSWSVDTAGFLGFLNASAPFVVWVDGDPAMRAALVSKATSSVDAISGLDLYQNRVIVSNEATSATTTTIADLSFFDGDDDPDIQYTANGGTLAVNAGQELHVKAGKTFAPGGPVVVNGNASASPTDGSFHIGTGATYIAGGTTTIAGNLIASSSSLFTAHASGTFFNATTTGKTINTTSTSSLGDVTFSGAGGGWSFLTNATTSDFTVSTGTVSASSGTMTVQGNFVNDGVFDGGGSLRFFGSRGGSISGTLTGTSALGDVIVEANMASTSDGLTEPYGNFVSDLPYPNLTNSGNAMASDDQYATGGFGAGSLYAFTMDTSGMDSISGMEVRVEASGLCADAEVRINSSYSKLFTAASEAVYILGGPTDMWGSTIAPTGSTTQLSVELITPASCTYSFDNVAVNVYGRTWSFASAASTTDLMIAASSTLVAPPMLSIAGDYTNNGTFEAGSGTTTLGGATIQVLSGTMVGTSAFSNLEIANTSGNGINSQSIVFAGPASTTDTLTMRASSSAAFSGATSTFQNIYLQGAPGQLIYLRSVNILGSEGVYNFYVPGTQKAVQYVDVRYANACPSTITAADGTSVDSGNNTCWDFGGDAPVISSAVDQAFSYGEDATDISTITVYDALNAPTITAMNDIRITIATSTVPMRWDAADTNAIFGGTAAAKVSNPVSYEDGDATLVIPVSSDFAAGDSLTISELRFADFTGTTSPAVALSLYTGGAGDTVADDADSKMVGISGSLTIDEHDAGQVGDQFTTSHANGVVLYRMKLTPAMENANISSLAFDLRGVEGLAAGDFTNLALYRDVNGNGSYDAGDVAVGGSGVPSVSGQTGAITFGTPFTASTSAEYLLRGDVDGIGPKGSVVVALTGEGIDATGEMTGVAITEAGTPSTVQHLRNGSRGGGGSGSAVGGPAPAGDGVKTGGGGGGGESIGNEFGFMAPTTSNGSWTTGENAYVSDDAYAVVSGNSAVENYGNFNFAIPAGSQITGIAVKLEARTDENSPIMVILSWDGGPSVTAFQLTSGTSATDAVYTVGGPADTWGRTWSSSDFNNGNFTVALTPTASLFGFTYLDAVQVRVYYEATGGGAGGGGFVSRDENRYLALVYGAAGEALFRLVRSFITAIF